MTLSPTMKNEIATIASLPLSSSLTSSLHRISLPPCSMLANAPKNRTLSFPVNNPSSRIIGVTNACANLKFFLPNNANIALPPSVVPNGSAFSALMINPANPATANGCNGTPPPPNSPPSPSNTPPMSRLISPPPSELDRRTPTGSLGKVDKSAPTPIFSPTVSNRMLTNIPPSGPATAKSNRLFLSLGGDFKSRTLPKKPKLSDGTSVGMPTCAERRRCEIN